MKRFITALLLCVFAVFAATGVGAECYRDLPDPQISLTGLDDYLYDSEPYVRVSFSVDNYTQFPNDLFQAAPHLPPCGANENSSRAWVDIYGPRGTYLYGYCSLSNNEQLVGLEFSVKQSELPSSFYIIIQDRECEANYTSNSVSTNMSCTKTYPNPIIEVTGTSQVDVGGTKYVEYDLDVTNYTSYADSLFDAAPHLPPCGANTNSARTWVDIYDQDDNYLMGFCGFTQAADLNLLYFRKAASDTQPTQVYIVLNDRECGVTYTSDKVSANPDCQLKLPKPQLSFVGRSQVNVGGTTMFEYDLDVSNYSSYPDALFTPSPNLPPCGANTNSARSWVDIYDQDGNYLMGFCGFTQASDLNLLYFRVDASQTQPTKAYIVINDRLCGMTYTSDSVNVRPGCDTTYPKPQVSVVGKTQVTVSGTTMYEYDIDIDNYTSYADSMFDPAPHLPPCGANTNSARTWVDIYDQDDNYLMGFCGFTQASDLNLLYFRKDITQTQPKQIYVVLNDRECGVLYTSDKVNVNQSCNTTYPTPQLSFGGRSTVTVGGSTMYEYDLDVTNYSSYPDSMFTASPHLPPCGANTNSARTWVDIYDQDGNYLMGFCGFTQAADLNLLYFRVDVSSTQPNEVYIVMNDRECEKQYTSKKISVKEGCGETYPDPQLVYTGSTDVDVSGTTYVEYSLDVSNFSSYPDAMFAKAPHLPACGANTNSARTWVDIYDQSGSYLMGFCGFEQASDLNLLYFRVDKSSKQPTGAYIVMEDRECGVTYTSNTVSLSGGVEPGTDDYTGWWYNALEPGSGLSMELQGDVLFLVWYAYTGDGTAEWYAAWLEKQIGTTETYAGNLRRYTGWALGEPWSSPSFEEMGELSVTFSDKSNAQLSWNLGIFSNPGTKTVTKYMPDLVPGGSADPRGIDGWWIDNSYSGMGFFFQAYGDTLFGGWYNYRDDSSPRWWTIGGYLDIGGFKPSDTTYNGILTEFSGGQTIGGEYKAASAIPDVTSAIVNFNGSGESLSITFEWHGTTYNLERYTFLAVP